MLIEKQSEPVERIEQWGMKFAVIDLETTGNEPKDAIIQVGLVLVDDMQMVERYTSLVNPGIGIPSYITGLTGITDDMVANAPKLGEVLPEVVSRIQDRVLVAHNAAFDLGYLQTGLAAHGYPPFGGKVLNTIDLLRILFPELSSLRLTMVAQQFGIAHERPHQADCDASVTAEIWLRCLKRLNELPLITIQRLSQLFDPLEGDLGWFLQQMRIRRELHTALDADTGRYFRQFAINVDDWGDERDARTDAQESEVRQAFADFYGKVKEALARKFSVYEERPSQELMIREVEDALEQGRHLLIEAGTGTGKSLGYLIPALYYGIREKKKVIVSTHTINLQEQLRLRDVPLLHEVFPVPFRAAVLKGRSHYLCLRKFEAKIAEKDFLHPQEDRITAAQMIVWLGETTRGDDEELHFGPKGADFWRTVESETDSCLNRACPWFKKCFYHRARHEANLADVVITNHSLLFTDALAENRLLPQYDHLIIDEAHHFEEVASKHFGLQVNYAGFSGTLIWLYKDAKSGLLPALRQKIARIDHRKTDEWTRMIDGLIPLIVQVKTDWDEMCELLYGLLARQDALQGETGQLVMRIRRDAPPAQWDKLQVVEDNLHLNLNDAVRQLEQLHEQLREEQDEPGLQGAVTDLGGALKSLARDRDHIRFFVRMPEEDYVYWAEANGYFKSKSVHLYSVPCDVSAMVQQYFFENKESIVMTSATLSVDKSFRFVCEQLGLDPEAPEHMLKAVQLPSPFDYRSQALVLIPRDFPSIRGSVGDAHFVGRLIESLRDVAIETKGRMLVLFTSYRMLRQVYPALKEQLGEAGIQVLGQGIDSHNRSKLTMLFQEHRAAVLMGTNSFWEGVDIPGEALSCLAIVRLPFQPPNHPLFEAKSEIIRRNQQNPFMKLSVPQAVIRFKQGFGRLVRNAKDRGVVVVYDTRVIDTQYGKYFLYSLPGPKIEHMTTDRLVPRIREWMSISHAGG
jgi:ATP-dependent DNA helicase DinG